MVIAPGPDSEGGIKSVVSRIVPVLEGRDDIDITWIASQRSGSAIAKILCFFKGLAQALLRFPRTDVVHLHGSVRLSLFRKSAFIWLARLMRCRVIYHFHAPQTVFETAFARSGLERWYALAVLRQCDAIVVLSDSWETIVRKALPDARIVVIYNPVMDTDRPVADNRADSADVLYLAHLIRRKGFDDLIKAFVEVVEQVPRARLVFCGSGETEYARELARELGILDNLVFHGWIEESEIAGALSTAAVFCLPSYDEGLPMGILEAMSSGVAVVTTPVGGVPDVLTHEHNALLVQPGDIPDLGKQLARLLLDSELRQRLAQAALRDSVAFRPQTIAQDWIETYRSVMADGQGASQ